MPKKTAKAGKRSGVLERKSSKLQKVPSLEENPKQFKHFHRLITLSAFRYALGRNSYVVGEVIEWLMQFWKEIPYETKLTIVNEIDNALMMGYGGDECDQKEWENFLEFTEKSMKFI